MMDEIQHQRRHTMSTPSNSGTALITGASTGIGSVYAHRLSQRGYDLVLVARDQQRLTKLANDITAKTGRKADILPADLTVKADLKRIEERLRSDTSITALVNNAGFGGVARLIDSDVDEMDNMAFSRARRGSSSISLRSPLLVRSCSMASIAARRLSWSISPSHFTTR
jgi:NADP-dependent 3-hydroxy acid dehydrogenase YdfG